MTQLIHTATEVLDPQTYGFNRSAVAIGIIALGFMVVVGAKLLDVLHQAGLPSVG